MSLLRALAVLTLLACGGCASKWVHPQASARSPRSVAVLPFLPRAKVQDEPLARRYAELLGRIVSGRLALGPYLLLPHTSVLARLEAAGLNTPEAARAAPREVLRRLLGVDLVIRGDLTEDAHLQAGLVFWRSLGYSVEAVDLRDGASLLTLEHSEVNLGGVLIKASQVLDGIESMVASHSDLAFIRLAELLAEELLTLLPAPKDEPQITTPAIEGLEVLVEGEGVPSSHKVGPESRVLVSLRGDPGQEATLRFLSGRAIPLPEVAPGVYRGVYRVAPGDYCPAPRVVLSDPYGAAAIRPLDLHVDLRRPLAPREVLAARRADRVLLSWPPTPAPSSGLGAGPDAGRYVVYGQKATGSLHELARVSQPAASLPADPRVERYFVAALSPSGVLGPPSSVGAP